VGLRELKKEQTRQLITSTAWRLFAERGFDRVSVAEVARAAQVSEATVFNYFPTKEDLFYSGLEAFGERLINAVTARAAGVSPLAAVRDFLSDTSGMLDEIEAGDVEALERARTAGRVIMSSPALLAREQLAIARNTEALAAALGGDITAQVAAHAFIGVHRTLLDFVRQRVFQENPGPIATDTRALVTQAFALLEEGLRDYA
jgi:AcrR family transcriptional regulator